MSIYNYDPDQKPKTSKEERDKLMKKFLEKGGKVQKLEPGYPTNVGSLDKSDANVGTGLVGAPECGDVMKLQIQVDPKTKEIVDAKFKTFGCGSAIASSSLATEWVKGKNLDEAMAIQNTEIVEELSLPPVKIHCSVLAEDAIKAAISDYKSRNKE